MPRNQPKIGRIAGRAHKRTARAGTPGVEALESRTLLANLLMNGGFEQPQVAAGADFRTVQAESKELAGWTITSGNIDVVTNQQPAEGAQSLDLNGTLPASFFQEFATVPGASYRLSFLYGNNPAAANASPSATVEVFGEDVSLRNDTIAHSGSTQADMRYTPYSTVFTADAAVSSVRFHSLVDGDGGVVLDAVSVEPDLADLAVAVQAPPSVTAGGELTYKITVTNAGPGAAQAVRMDDTLPANTSFVSLVAPAGWAVTTPAPGAAGAVSATAQALPGAATATFTLVVRVAPGTPAGTAIADTARVATTTPDPAANNAATATSTVAASLPTGADLLVTIKDAPDPVSSRGGGTITYTITVTNVGPAAAQNVVLTDVMPPNLFFVSFRAPAGWTASTPELGCPGMVITATTPSLAGGATAVFTLTAQIFNYTSPGNQIPNPVSVTTTTRDTDAANNAATAITAVVANLTGVARRIVPLGPHALREHAVQRRADNRAFSAFARQVRAEFRLSGKPGARSAVVKVLRDLRAQWREELDRPLALPFCFPAL